LPVVLVTLKVLRQEDVSLARWSTVFGR